MPSCEHGIEIDEDDCSVQGSHFTHRGLSPAQVLSDFFKTGTDIGHRCRDTVSHMLDVSYGDSPSEKLDLFGYVKKDCPILAFIHGGLWQMGCRKDSCFMVERLVNKGWAVAVIGYGLAPESSLSQIVAQINRALEYLARLAAKNSCEGLWLCGHSAGAHLVAMAIAQADVCVLGRISCVFLLSGIFDLAGVISRDYSKILCLNDTSTVDLSPVQHVPHYATLCRHISFHFVNGDSEGPWYQEQSKTFHHHLSEAGAKATLHVMPETDHFTMLTQFDQPHHDTPFELLKLIFDSSRKRFDDVVTV